MTLTVEIKEFALDLGYSRIGFTDAENFSEYIDEVKSRGKMYDYFWEGTNSTLVGAKPKEIMPSAQSIIVLVWDYFQKAFPESLTDKIGRIYLDRGYNAPANRINGARFQLMKDFLAKKGIEANAGIKIPFRWAAAKAGVTNFGKNTFAYADGIGSFIIIIAIVVDKKLDYGVPSMECKCPPGCNACINSCPTQAIYEPFKLNPRKCLAFNETVTLEGRSSGISTYIPHGIREKTGIHVHGCDICQEVCPRNRKKMKSKFPNDDFLMTISKDFSLNALLSMSDEFYKTRVQPIMFNYIKEPKYFQRNAAIAIGNTGDPFFLSVLEIAMGSPEELIRAHTAWALGKIGGSSAKQILKSALGRENSEKVREEIEMALSRIKKQDKIK